MGCAQTKRVKELLEVSRVESCADVKFAGYTGGRHMSFLVTAKNGQRKKFFASTSPSDRRATQNHASLVRQFCEANQ